MVFFSCAFMLPLLLSELCGTMLGAALGLSVELGPRDGEAGDNEGLDPGEVLGLAVELELALGDELLVGPGLGELPADSK
mmetsp:Transcript_90642/g.227911  ORF Transcript_90642/g.227911 Transcript_90642/m.227911 type:complete len:80 (+) Transcript_90642:400-639(+)